MQRRHLKSPILLLFFLLGWGSQCNAYSVLAHEAIIDASWDKILVPLLYQKFPGASTVQIAQAKSYAYGGAVIPDMKDYPFGDRKFTNLIHYVRPGDFVTAMLHDAKDLNEYAFALGIMSHYYADCYGHKISINLSVPEIYPRMKRKFGDTVTFANDHLSHARVEFGLDVLQSASGNFVSNAIHRATGFRVAQRLLEEAFLEIYGIEVKSLFGNFRKVIAQFRRSLVWVYPEAITAGWIFRKEDLRNEIADMRDSNFIYRIPGRPEKKEERSDHKKPGPLARIVALYIRFGPRIGQSRALKFTTPQLEQQKLFVQSFDSAVLQYSENARQLASGIYAIDNIDYDTGKPTAPGEYILADKCYAMLLFKLQRNGFNGMNESLKKNILSFYDQPAAEIIFGRDAEDAKKINEALEMLRK